jgi:alpha-tubulin suppressor-like RCC1 family protein
VHVASGFRHTLVVCEGGNVFVFGFNRNGRLGIISTLEKLDVAVRVPFPTSVRILKVGCGYGHSAAVAEDGSLFTWGHVADGALGLGDVASAVVDRPTRVESIGGPVVHVSCGGVHTLAITLAGILFCSGSRDGLGTDLAGKVFRSWDDQGEITMAQAGGKYCVVVAKSHPHDVFVFGTLEFESHGQEPQNPHMRVIGATVRSLFTKETNFVRLPKQTKGPITNCGTGVKMCSLLDGAGNVYVSQQGVFQCVLHIKAAQIAQGILSLIYLEKVCC